MIFELVGLPGSGKTLAAAGALELLAGRGVGCVGFAELDRYRSEHGDRYLSRCSAVRRLPHFCALYLHQPGVVARVLWLTLLHGPLSRRRWRKARRALAMLLMVLRLRQAFPDRVLILDDGFLQKIWSTLVESTGLRGLPHVEALLTRYYARTGIRCILLQVADDVAGERVFARSSRGRFNRDAGERQRSDFGRWIGYHHALSSRLPQQAIVTRIDAAAAPQQVAAAVADAIIRAADSVKG